MQEKTKKKLLTALAKVIEKHRKCSISKLCNEIDLSKSIWSGMAKGSRDIQLTTFFRIAEAMNVRPSDLLKEIEKELGEKFSFVEDD